MKSREEKLPKNQAPVVQWVDNTIHRMNLYSPIGVVITYNAIHWMVIFQVDSVIHPLNQAQVIKINFLHTQWHLIKGHNIHMHIKFSLPCEKCI